MNNNSRKIHMYIGPKFHDYMSISEKNSARSLAKYSIHREFSGVDSFYNFCGQFYNEGELLRAAYRGRDDIHALCGRNLGDDLTVRAYDESGTRVSIVYGVKPQLSEEARVALYEWYAEAIKRADNRSKNAAKTLALSKEPNDKWRPY